MRNFSSEQDYLDWWKRNNENRQDAQVTIQGLTLFVSKDVFSPDPELTHSSSLLLDSFSSCQGKTVLDIGTGSGVLSIHAAKRGAKSVLAVDCTDDAVANVEENIKQHSADAIVKVTKSDLFQNVSGKYDLILANLPIFAEAWTNLSKGIPQIYQEFFSKVHDHLTKSGIALVAFASFGDLKAFTSAMTMSPLKWTKTTVHRFASDWMVFRATKN